MILGLEIREAVLAGRERWSHRRSMLSTSLGADTSREAVNLTASERVRYYRKRVGARRLVHVGGIFYHLFRPTRLQL